VPALTPRLRAELLPQGRRPRAPLSIAPSSRARVSSVSAAGVAQSARASACHAEGRGFESLHPLQTLSEGAAEAAAMSPVVCRSSLRAGAPGRRSQVVRQRSAKPPSPVRLRSPPPESPCIWRCPVVRARAAFRIVKIADILPMCGPGRRFPYWLRQVRYRPRTRLRWECPLAVEKADADHALQLTPTWLRHAHECLDHAAHAAYGWPYPHRRRGAHAPA
jgi:hypothetical protein